MQHPSASSAQHRQATSAPEACAPSKLVRAPYILAGIVAVSKNPVGATDESSALLRTVTPHRALRALMALFAFACASFIFVWHPHAAYADELSAAPSAFDAPAAHVVEGTYRIVCKGASGMVLDCPKASSRKGLQMAAAKAGASDSQKYYVRNEGSGLVSLQSAASGLFLAQVDEAVVQLPDASTPDRRWKLREDLGIAFVNAESGQLLAFDAGKAVAENDAGSATQRWKLTRTKLIANGYYKVKSARGGYLDSAKSSYAAGAAMQASKTGVKTAEVFKVTGNASGYYQLESSRTFMTLTAKGASSSAKGVVQAEGKGNASQLWKVSLDRTGGLVFKDKKTKRVLQVAAKPTKSGVAVSQGKSAGEVGQRWTLVKSKRYSLSGDTALDKAIAALLAKHGTLREAYDHIAFGYRYISANEIRSGKYLSKATSVKYAKEFFSKGGGNCYRFSSAMSLAARGLGYSSRVVAGWVPGNLEPHAPHGWCEVYRSGKTYVCDPDMYNAVRDRNWYMRTYENAPVAYGFWS